MYKNAKLTEKEICYEPATLNTSSTEMENIISIFRGSINSLRCEVNELFNTSIKLYYPHDGNECSNNDMSKGPNDLVGEFHVLLDEFKELIHQLIDIRSRLQNVI